MKITTLTGAPWSADASTAHKILTVSNRTPKERLQMCDFYHCGPFDKSGVDCIAYRFEDGSQIIATIDDCLCPGEMIEVRNSPCA